MCARQVVHVEPKTGIRTMEVRVVWPRVVWPTHVADWWCGGLVVVWPTGKRGGSRGAETRSLLMHTRQSRCTYAARAQACAHTQTHIPTRIKNTDAHAYAQNRCRHAHMHASTRMPMRITNTRSTFSQTPNIVDMRYTPATHHTSTPHHSLSLTTNTLPTIRTALPLTIHLLAIPIG